MALNSFRSSIPSPTPIYRIGIFNSSVMPTMIPPLAVPSNLVRTIPVTPTGFVEEFCLRDGILTSGGVEDKKNLVRGPRAFSPDNPFHLLQLFHEIDFGVEPPGRINEDKIDISRLGSMDGVEGHGRGI